SIENAKSHVWRDDFNHRDFGASLLVSYGVHHVGSLQCEKASLFDLHTRDRNVGADRTLFSERFSERHARLNTFAHQLEGPLGHADRPHAMVDPPGSQAPLGDLKSPSLAEQTGSGGPTDICECNCHA